ncbi:response regulator transcription factor (plasmid) [Sinorhizobium mexicanum]|uniref:Response regulator transcription factor n=2 Tax=Sinorhizobium mexicanum TaxID=375549 RepID=A0A859QVY4_9HYPH|nr:response regulator transcription factor [Sinorhizobium mexicanum]QLL66277.1 response regulator transcription factor [Sinorhizobium mexicanum]
MKAQHARPLVLICSDNADFYVLLSHILVREGFQTILVGDDDVFEQASVKEVTAIILDSAREPSITLTACAAIKGTDATSHIPTIALVSAGDERHYLNLLKAGIDENFVRPVSPARLLAYLSSLVQSGANRPRPAGENPTPTVGFGALKLDEGRRTVSYGDREIQLGPIEFKLLRRLFESPGRVFSRLELIEAAWPPNIYVQARTVDVHVGRLRRSLQRLTGLALIRTVRAAGYAINI